MAGAPDQSIQAMWNILRQLAWLAAIPSWFSAVTFWQKVMALHWLAAPLLIAVLTIWTTLAVQRIWHRGVLQRWYRNARDYGSAIDLLSALGFRAPLDRAIYVRGFIRMPEGEEPPVPVFKGNRSGAIVERPWRPIVPKTAGELWVATSFVYPDPASGICAAMPAKKVKARSEQYSIDAERWRTGDRRPTDRYMRYQEPREPSIRDLSSPIVLETRASNRSRIPEWLQLLSTVVRSGHSKKSPVPPMKLSAVKELRVVVQTYGAKFVTAETTLSAIEKLELIPADTRPEMTRLVCTFHEHAQSNVLEAVVRSPIYHDQHDGLRFALDFIGDPSTGVVDTVGVEGAIPKSDNRYHDIATVYFR